MRALFALLLSCLCLPVSAAQLEVRIDLSDQEMTIFREGQPTDYWRVSTARDGKFTPIGLFSVKSMKPMHYSTLYDNAPMPWSIFFYGNFAIHGTTQIDRLGAPASAGCVRLHPDDAKQLYNLVLYYGRSETLIHIVP